MRKIGAVVALGMLLTLFAAVPALASEATEITNSGDNLRTGWYPDEPSITPRSSAAAPSAQLWSAPVEGQVYAQPLLADGALFVATENNDIYSLNPGDRRAELETATSARRGTRVKSAAVTWRRRSG